MRLFDRILMLFLVFALPLSSVCFADSSSIVELKNGKTLEGFIDSSTTLNLRVRNASGIVTLKWDQISTVTQIGDNAGRPERFLWSINNTRWLQTILYVQESQLAFVDSEMMKNMSQVISECRNATTETVLRLDTYVFDRPTAKITPNLMLLCVECWGASGDTPQAVTRLEDLNTSYPNFLTVDEETKKWTIRYLKDGMKYSLENGDVELGSRCLYLLSVIQPNIAGVDSKLIWLANAASKTDRNDFEGAMRIITHYVAPLDMQTAFAEGLILLNRMDNANLDANVRFRTSDVFVGCFLNSPYAKFTVPRVTAFIEQLVKREEDERAELLVEKLRTIDEPAAIRSANVCVFEKMLRNVSRNDVQSVYELAGWAKDHELTGSAVLLYRQIQNDPNAGENVGLQLQLIDRERASVEIEKMGDAIRIGSYDEVLRIGRKFLRDCPNSSASSDVVAQMELAKFRMSQAKQTGAAKAEVLMQNAERAYYEGKFDQSVQLLIEIEADYNDAPAAKRARDLRRRMGLLRVNDSGTLTDNGRMQENMSNALAARAAYMGTLQGAYDKLQNALGDSSK